MNKQLLSILVLCLTLHLNAQENSLLWSINKPGSKDTSYLFGSIHISDQRVFNVNKHFNRVFDKAEIVALELHFDSINPFELMNFIMMDSALTLKKIMPADKYTFVKNYFKDSLGQELTYIERFQPIYIATMLQTQGLNTTGTSLDESIFKRAKENNKRIEGLEKAHEQMSAFSVVSYRVQAEMLYLTIKYMLENSSENDTQKLIEYYIHQDLKGLDEMVNNFTFSEEHSIKMHSDKLNDALIIKRNHRMLERSLPLVEKQTTLIVVGAAHLIGEAGLIELYRKQGFEVNALK
ncbi:MAG: TraB/GumN family protein [Bacteroidia bacterium]